MKTVKFTQQAESAECGLAALVMIARSHGREVDMAWARHRFPAASRRPDLASLLTMAGQFGLAARPLRAETGDLAKLRLPAILHWKFRHFVVLTRVRRRAVEICDPACGCRRIGARELNESFTGVALELTPLPDRAPTGGLRQPGVAGLLARLRGLHVYLAVMLLLLVVTQLLGLAVPVASQLLIDEFAAHQDRDGLAGLLAGMCCIMLAALVLDALRQHVALFTRARVSLDLASATVQHLLAVPAATLQRRTIADTISRIDSLQPIQTAMTDTALAAMVQLVTLFVTLALMIFYSPLLASVSLATLVGTVALQLATLPRLRARNMDGVIAQSQARQSLLESLTAAASVQAFGLASLRVNHWQRAFVRANNARTAQGRLILVAGTAQRVLGMLDQVAFLALGMAAIGKQTLTLGILFAFVTLRGRLAAALGGLLLAASDGFLLRNHLERVGDLLGVRARRPASDSARRAVPSGQLGCTALGFAWQDGERVLDDIHCEIEAGERVVICGPSGIGKSTLLRLLACELEPAAGSVHFDDWDAGLWDRDWLQNHFGIVRQSDRLFGGTVADNISGFSPNPDPERIRHAAERASVWQDLVNLPLRLETTLDDGGTGLSGGQVQRLLLARALYREPRVLFLDEATSQLDERTERRVLTNLAGLSATIVSIAHGVQAIGLGGRPICLGGPANGKTPASLS
jgi:ATP-binding cassette, subfamily B, bacterial CvaB/MchF/RaxB